MSQAHKYRFRLLYTPSIKLHGDVVAITLKGINTKNQPMTVSFEAEWFWLVNFVKIVQGLWSTVLLRRVRVNKGIQDVFGG